MKSVVIFLLAFTAIASCKDDKTISKEHLVDMKEPIKDDNEVRNIDEEKTISDLKPKEEGKEEVEKQSKEKPRIYFEVIRVNEKLVVDSKNTPKAFSADVNNSLYTIQSGHLRRIYNSEMKIVPKPGSPIFKRLQAASFVSDPSHPGEPGDYNPDKDNWKLWREWLENMARRLRLDQFWPRLIFSIILGFASTMLIYLIAMGLIFLFGLITGRNLLNSDEDYQEVQSTEQLLDRESKRANETKPLLPNNK